MKKLAVMLAAMMMLVTLIGCSSNSDTPADDQGSTEEATMAIKVGASGPLSGGVAIYGNAVKNAAEIAVEEVNALGGLQFELNFQDDEHNEDKAVSAFGALLDWGMQISMHTVTSAPGAAVSPLYQEEQIFAITPSGSSPAVTFADINDDSTAYGNIFQMCFSDPGQGTASATYIKNHNLGEKIAVIYKNDDNYSTGVYDKFMAEVANNGLNVVYVGAFDDSNATDFSVQLAECEAAGADVVFLPIYYQPAALILDRANKVGYSPIFFGVDGMDGILTLENFDTSLAEGVYLLTPFDANAEDEKTQHFVKAYMDKFGEIPNQFAADAYDVVYALYEACTAAGITPDMSNADICAAMIKQFTTMTFEGITGESKWITTGEVRKDPLAVVIENGVYVSAE